MHRIVGEGKFKLTPFSNRTKRATKLRHAPLPNSGSVPTRSIHVQQALTPKKYEYPERVHESHPLNYRLAQLLNSGLTLKMPLNCTIL